MSFWGWFWLIVLFITVMGQGERIDILKTRLDLIENARR